MKTGWKVVFLILVFVLLVGNVIQLALIRSLQEDRNRIVTYLGNNDRLWDKQFMFNRFDLYGKGHHKYADKEWPLPRASKYN